MWPASDAIKRIPTAILFKNVHTNKIILFMGISPNIQYNNNNLTNDS